MLVLVGGNLSAQSGIDFCSRLALYYVPHLGLPGASVAFLRQFVVGVNLNREVLPRVYELYQQRKFVSVLLVNLSAHKLLLVLVYKLR